MKVAIAGYDVEGKASYRYWRNVVGAEVTILDEKPFTAHQLPYGSRAFTGPDALDDLAEFDLVVRTAGLNPKKLKGAKKVWSGTNEFFEKCPAPIIGVTGTKGKGTTASLIASILKAAGKTVHLVGNIGVAALEILPEIKETDIVVYELSSFQLWDIEKSPHVAVVLMIEPDHLDVHKNMDEYVNAKANIRRFQYIDDECFYHPSNKYSEMIAHCDNNNFTGAERAGWLAMAYPYATDATDGGVYVKDDYFYIRDEKLCSVDAVMLPGAHNIENACAAISAALVYNPSHKAIEQGLRSFTGLPHRLKFVREVSGVKYYDDSIATTPGSAIAAIRSFDQPKVLILGGHDKGSDYKDLIDEVMRNEHMRAVILMGANADKLEKVFRKKDKNVNALKNKSGKSLSEVVQAAATCAQPGDVVILSPAAASFDMFSSYADRGDQFVTAVEAL